MEFQKVLQTRYSVRSFSNTPVEQDKIDKILESARIAPSGKNTQPQRICVLTTADDLAIVDQSTRGRYGAPLVFLICCDKSDVYHRPDGSTNAETDIAIAATYMMLTATDLGLGTLWVRNFHAEKTAELFNLSKELTPAAYLMVGYPTSDCEPDDWHHQRKSIQQLLIRR
jgi:nitroreductase